MLITKPKSLTYKTMNQLNFCFECSYRCKLPKPLSKSMLKITQKTQNLNLQLQRLMDQLIDQKYKDHDTKCMIIKNYE